MVELLQTVFISLMVFVMLKFSHKISTGSIVILVVIIMLGCSLWTFILSIVGKFKRRTERCCRSWKHVKCNYVDEFRYMKVVKKSCHPITIWAGKNIFELQIKHIPMFLYIIAYNVIVWNVIYRNYFC